MRADRLTGPRLGRISCGRSACLERSTRSLRRPSYVRSDGAEGGCRIVGWRRSGGGDVSISSQRIVGVIPARYRLDPVSREAPRACLGDRTVLHHVHERARVACLKSIASIVAIDDDRVLREVLVLRRPIAGMTSRIVIDRGRTGLPRRSRHPPPTANSWSTFRGTNRSSIRPRWTRSLVRCAPDPEAIWTAVAPLTDAEASTRPWW